ncbi:MAG TPA: TIM-barrel domain-containing protein [Ruminiclostridium sp.]
MIELVAPGIWRFRMGMPEGITPLSILENKMKMEELTRLPEINAEPFNSEELHFELTTRGCLVELPLSAKDRIYGLGLQLKSHNQTGKKKIMRTNSDPVADTGDSHAPVPFYVSTAGYGVLVDTARYVSFHCGTHSKTGKGAMKDRGGQIANNTSDLYAMDKPSDERNMIIEIPSVKGVDIFIFGGPTMKDVVQRYNLFSGGGCLPPYWGLGVWYRTCGSANAEEMVKLAKDLRDAQIPCDVFGLEPGWQSHSYSCSYKWNPERINNPQLLTESLNNMNYKINLWEHVFVHPTAAIYEEMKENSADYEVWGGLVPDLSKQEARNIFSKHHKKEFIQKGISGFKLDECDSSDYCGSQWSFPDFTQFPSGMDGEQMHSLLGILYQKTLMEAFQQENKRTYCQVRSSHALAAPYPFVLYSDLYDHRDFVRGVVNMGFTGLLWSPEVRQCDSVEELVRRIQTVVFSPQALINAWMIPNPPWLQYDFDKNTRGEFLDNKEEVQEICKKLFELRTSLIPYLYSSFVKYHLEGIPPFRALVMDWPEDENVFDIDDEYMMGDSMLIAPIFTGQTGRKVYLPEGGWYCFWTHEWYEGGRYYEIKAELEIIPVYIKEGSLLPLAKSVEYVEKDTCFEITIYAFGEICREIILYEDDGETFDFDKGSYNRVSITYSEDKGIIEERSGNYSGIRYKILNKKE